MEYGSSRWTVVSTGMYFYQQDRYTETRDWFLKFFVFDTKETRVITKLPGMPVIGQPPAISPDGSTLLYTQIDINDTDLMHIENFR